MGAIDQVIILLLWKHQRYSTISFDDYSIAIGLIVGYLFHKMLKIAIVAAIIVVVACFGFFGLSLGALKGILDVYGPIAIQ